MATLRRWFQREYARLTAQGKGALVERFESFLRDFFDENAAATVAAIPDLYNLADVLDEPVWRLIVDYYVVSTEIYWQGELAKGRDRVTHAAVQAARLCGAGDAPEIYLREWLLYAWLNTDLRGYARDLVAAADEVLSSNLEPDVALRYNLMRAHGLAHSGAPQEAFDLLSAMLAREKDWPDPYHNRLRGTGLCWVERYEDALICFRHAVEGYHEIAHHIESNNARLRVGDAFLRLNRPVEALDAAREGLSAAEHLPNRYHEALARGLVGRALAQLGQLEEGADYLRRAVVALDGLGWMRSEAELALDWLKTLSQMKVSRFSGEWETALEIAQHRIGRLRSTDLRDEMAALVDGGGSLA